MIYKVTYYKVGIWMGKGKWVTEEIEAASYSDARDKTKKKWGFRNITSIEWVR